MSVAKASVLTNGSYTSPKTWGVYRIDPPRDAIPTKSYRIGNHPMRHRELEREFGRASVEALFKSRAQAEELAALLNARLD